MLMLLFQVTLVSANDIHVVESTFCLKMAPPACEEPAINSQVTLSQIRSVENGIKRLYFWTSIAVSEDKTILHIWKASNRADKWASPVHVSYSDRAKNTLLEFAGHVRDFLYKVFEADPSLHSVQGVMLPIDKSPRFRTYSKARAIPGKYTVEVTDLNGNILPGGEAKYITVLAK